MTQSEALGSFSATMTDDEMRDLWLHLETEGCTIVRYNPTSRASDKNLWRMRITNPSWNSLVDTGNAIKLYYKQRKDGSWARVADDTSWVTVV